MCFYFTNYIFPVTAVYPLKCWIIITSYDTWVTRYRTDFHQIKQNKQNLTQMQIWQKIPKEKADFWSTVLISDYFFLSFFCSFITTSLFFTFLLICVFESLALSHLRDHGCRHHQLVHQLAEVAAYRLPVLQPDVHADRLLLQSLDLTADGRQVALEAAQHALHTLRGSRLWIKHFKYFLLL